MSTKSEMRLAIEAVKDELQAFGGKIVDVGHTRRHPYIRVSIYGKERKLIFACSPRATDNAGRSARQQVRRMAAEIRMEMIEGDQNG